MIPGESIICPWTTPLAYATEAVPGRGPAAAAHPGTGRAARAGRSTRCGTIARPAALPLAGQRRRAVQRPDRRDARRRAASPSRPRRGELIVFDKLARPLLSVDPAAGADRADQGRAGRAHRVRQRAARARPPRTSPTGPTPPPPRPGWPRCWTRAAGSCPELAGRGGHRHLRRAARRDRAPGLPDPGGRAAGATRAWPGSGPPACPRRWASPSTSPASSAAAGLPLASRETGRARPPCRTSARPGRGRTRTRRGSPPTRSTARSSATASGSPGARSATRWPARCRPADLDGLRRRTRACNGRCQGFYCAATVSELLMGRRPSPATPDHLS